MKVGLFVPCYVDQFYPQVAVATLELLERLGCDVAYPREQTCCGQPMANAGWADEAEATHRHAAACFGGFDYVVGPSGSCVLHLREHVERTSGVRYYELCQFLVDVLRVERLRVSFPRRVGVHASCHGLRGLRLGPASEIQERKAPPLDRVARLLDMVDGLERVALDRPDECCGFGGMFAVQEEAVSVRMGADRLEDHLRQGVEVVTGTDMSCLMHLEGLIRRRNLPLRVVHVAEILNGSGEASHA